MLRAMFGMGGSEILVILIVALIFLGPDKLPEAAKQISKGIRDIKKQSRALQQTIEDDENIGGALRDLRSALRGEEPPPSPPKRKQIEAPATPDPIGAAAALTAAADAPATTAEASDTPAPAPAKDPHEHDVEVAASVFADSFESGHMAAPATTPGTHTAEASAAPVAADPAPRITLPPTAGEPGEATAASASRHADADLAALVKPAPNTIARGATSAAASGAASTVVSGAASTAASGVASTVASGAASSVASAETSTAASGASSGPASAEAPAPSDPPSGPEHG
jgi:sec-independent protein translocase protein TatB